MALQRYQKDQESYPDTVKMFKILAICAAGVMVAGMTSCRKELCYNHFRTAAVALDWEQEWERDYGMSHATTWDLDLHGFDYGTLRPDIPEGVTMITYTDDDSPRETYMDTKGADINLGEPGEHTLLFYNNDTEYIVFSDMASLAEARAYTTSRSRATLATLEAMYPTVRSTNPPDILYASYESQLPAIGLHESTPLPVTMQPLVYTYVIRYEFEYGIQHVALARGALAGMAESVYLRNGVTSEESSIILYDCDIKPYGCEAHVRTFGVPGFPDEFYGRSEVSRADRPYTLNLEVRLQNGKSFEFNYDIADQILSQPRGGIIRISGIRIEDEQSFSDSGFDVEVSDWGEHEDIDLPDNIFSPIK